MNLPITMTGKVNHCVQLTYRTPADTVRGLLPRGLEFVQRGPWAFWNVMACRVDLIRPLGVPEAFGLVYHHVAYRLLVQAMTRRAEVVRGLYFTRSDVDMRAVSMLGNRLTSFRMHPGAIRLDATDCGINYAVRSTSYARGDMDLAVTNAPAHLRPNSCFPTTQDARQFCRYIPNALDTAEADGERLLKIVRVHRAATSWSETPLAVHNDRLGYFESIGQDSHAELEWACRLGPMDYQWKIGETVALLQQPRASAASQLFAERQAIAEVAG